MVRNDEVWGGESAECVTDTCSIPALYFVYRISIGSLHPPLGLRGYRGSARVEWWILSKCKYIRKDVEESGGFVNDLGHFVL